MRRSAITSFALALIACSAPAPPPTTRGEPPRGLTPPDKIPIVDSHVHLAYYPVAAQLAAHRVRAVVDLASPESALGTKYPIKVIQSGPMLTRPGGYPLDSWGADGYGIGCADHVVAGFGDGEGAKCVTSTIDRLIAHGAGVIKIALDSSGLDLNLAMLATRYAHERGLKVAVHALTDKGVLTASVIGADVLAHTPLESLSQQTIDSWKRRMRWERRKLAVISTLTAFGGTDTAVDNLRRLREAGLIVLYGTDLGNLRVDGPSQEEIMFLKLAGLDDEAVTAAMTTVPWHYWGFDSR